VKIHPKCRHPTRSPGHLVKDLRLDILSIDESPLEPVFAGHPSVPVAFAEQFLHTKHRPYGMMLEGVMHTIWHRPRVLRPLFWALGKLGILVPHQGREVPTTLVVRPGRDPIDGVYHIWDRTFQFPHKICFRTTIIYDVAIGKVVDLVGPGNVLYMVWDARFHEPNRFTLDTNSCAFRIGGTKFWMPRWFWKLLLGTVTFSQVADLTQRDVVRVDLLVVHPVFGKIFGYEGTFRTVRTEKAGGKETATA
jgi:Domain of unknown function (DUF4166)